MFVQIEDDKVLVPVMSPAEVGSIVTYEGKKYEVINNREIAQLVAVLKEVEPKK
jgi:hypothetical protein